MDHSRMQPKTVIIDLDETPKIEDAKLIYRSSSSPSCYNKYINYVEI